MRYYILGIAVVFFINVAHAQSSMEQQLELLNKQRLNERIYLDTNYHIQSLAPLEVEYFNVEFSKVTFDKEKKVINLTGKICFHDKYPDCMGLTGVAIFLAKEKKGKLTRREIIGETSSIEEGFFDVSFSVNRKKKLYFYYPLFFAQKFDIYKVIE